MRAQISISYAIIKVVNTLSGFCGLISAVMILLSVFITCQMIFLRSVMGVSTVWQTEAVIYLMIAATLIGLPYVQKLRGHVGVDLLPTLLPPHWKQTLTLMSLVITASMILIMLVYGWEMFELAARKKWRSETVWAVSLWIPYIFVPLGFGLFLLQLIADIWQTAVGQGSDNLVQIDQTEYKDIS